MAVIVKLPITMPIACVACPFAKPLDSMKLYCEWFPQNEPVSYSDKRPDWCPLEET